jgi:hypothetical protein
MIMTVAAFLGAHSICHAVLIVTANPNPPQSAPYIATHKVLGDMMEGMTVTARFSDGTSETAPWLATGTPKEGQAMGASGEWHLTQKGNTFNHLWTLEYHQNGGQRLLTGVTLDGMASGILDTQVVFDRSKDASGASIGIGTPVSALGKDFVTSPDPFPHFNIFATYYGEVTITGNPPDPSATAVGDIYRFLDIRFNRSDDDVAAWPHGLDGYDINSLSFYQDTDNLSRIPEPSSLVMGCLSLGLIAYRRKRKGILTNGVREGLS